MNEFKLYLHFQYDAAHANPPLLKGWIGDIKPDDLAVLEARCCETLQIHIQCMLKGVLGAGTASSVSHHHLQETIMMPFPDERAAIKIGGPGQARPPGERAAADAGTVCTVTMTHSVKDGAIHLLTYRPVLFSHPGGGHAGGILPGHKETKRLTYQPLLIPYNPKEEACSGTGTIVVAEDEEDMAYFLEKALRHEGFEVETACDGVEAKEKIMACRPDVILLDIVMPRMDGWEVLRWLREEEKLSTPTIIISAKEEMDDLKKGYELEADFYMVKPLRIANLIQSLQTVLFINSLPKEFE